MITREQYIEGNYTNEEYYGQFAETLINLVINCIGKDRIIASTDKFFNDIPLREWDALYARIKILLEYKLIENEESNSLSLSLSDTVCAAKAAAELIRNKSRVRD